MAEHRLRAAVRPFAIATDLAGTAGIAQTSCDHRHAEQPRLLADELLQSREDPIALRRPARITGSALVSETSLRPSLMTLICSIIPRGFGDPPTKAPSRSSHPQLLRLQG
ncbi:hypothetical protein [Roseiflexus sp.]|uniref:hypothetical protein n=1 Tax=Roseiflexus sp. TaxID=2562120 RepID=UPI00398ADDBA